MFCVLVDPVMRSKAGDTLLEPSATEVMKKELFPISLIITPNLDEASVLTGIAIDSISKMRGAAEGLYSMGPKNVVIKGGHLEGDCVDLFYDGQRFVELPAERIETKNTHGTGCTFSAAIATEIANGRSPLEAVRRAKTFITAAIHASLSIGSGHGPTNPFSILARDGQIFACAGALSRALWKLQAAEIGHLIPEIQSNLGYAINSAESPEDVVAFPGRIIRLGSTAATVAAPAAGASRHIAKVILTALKHDSRFRSAMNIAWRPDIIEPCRELGFSVGEFDRNSEPPDIKALEGSTLEWGTGDVISREGKVPDIIFDRGDVGKEPITRVLGTDPEDVADKIIKIASKRNS